MTGCRIQRWLRQRATFFRGEFGRELIAVIPYAYWLFLNRKLLWTQSVRDTRCLYWFSKRHIEWNLPRKHDKDSLAGFPVRYIHAGKLDTSQWVAPPYKKIYENPRFVWRKPLCVIANKYSEEWKGPPVNHLSLDTLRRLFDQLAPRYQVVYNRPSLHIRPDGQEDYDLGDFEMIRRQYAGVVMIMDDLFLRNRDQTFNGLQMRVYANCSKFITVQGGGAVLGSYFGGTNILFAKKGQELKCGAYQKWYPLFSGCRVIPVSSEEEVPELAGQIFLPGEGFG